MAHHLITRGALGTLTKLGQGGQGIVYQAPKVKTTFADAMVFKEYKPHARGDVDFEALSAMPVLVEDTLPYDDGKGLVSIAAWPCALVEDSIGTVGFVMPAIPDSFYIDVTTVKGVSRNAAEFQHLLNSPSVLIARGIAITDEQRYQLVREVAKAMSFLHRISVRVGDVSPKNVLFTLNPRPAVYFIDCDAVCVNGVSALPQLETPDWEVPDGEELATVYSDTYKLGLLALRLLSGDQHTRDPRQLSLTTPKPLRQLITDTLVNAPDRRPLPEAWTYVLGRTLEEIQNRAQTQTALKPTPPTHVPEPQPVIRSRPTATPSTQKKTAAKVSGQPVSPTVVSTGNRRALALGAGIVLVVLLAALSHFLTRDTGSSPSTSSTKVATSATPNRTSLPQTTQSAPTQSPPSQSILPLPGLQSPQQLAVDSAGNLYVTPLNGDLLKLPPGGSEPTIVPISGVASPSAVAVDNVGNLYVAEYPSTRVLKVAPGATNPTTLPFSGLMNPMSIAVDGVGDVYVADADNNRIVKLEVGTGSQIVLPFTGLSQPRSVAVDTAGNVYVADYRNDRVLQLPTGSNSATELPLPGLNGPQTVAVDTAGSVYVVDSNRVRKLVAGAATPTNLPFVGLKQPLGLAVNTGGDVYVASYAGDKVFELPAR